MRLPEFNALPRADAEAALLAVCAAPRWAGAVAAGRPYRDVAALQAAADAALAALDEEDVDAALAGHPRIGERTSNAASQHEQAGVAAADASVLAALDEGNRAYERWFGHVYLVCASGRTAEELLAVLHDRLGNDHDTERRVIRTELGKINRLRLAQLAAGGER